MKRLLLLASLGPSLLLAGCSGDGDAPAKAQGPPGGPPPAKVKIGEATSETLTDTWRYLGHVQPKHQTTVAAGVSGYVLAVEGREGDVAEAGAPIVTLDTALIEPRLAASQAEIARIGAALAQARRDLARVEKLETPFVTAAERDRYETSVATLAAQLHGARATAAQLSAEKARHTLTAPFAGAIAQRHVDPGAWVSPGTPLLELVSVASVEIHVQVPLALHRHLEVGLETQLQADDGATVEAEVKGVVPALSDRTRTLLVRLEPVAPTAWLMPGAPVTVAFPLTLAPRGGVVVSRDALVRGPVNVRVMAVREGKAVQIPVEIIATADDQALVKGEGLVAGDQVVVQGNERLRPGQPVEVIE